MGWVEFPVQFRPLTHQGFRIVVKNERVVFGFWVEIDRLGFSFGVDLVKVDREKRQSW